MTDANTTLPLISPEIAAAAAHGPARSRAPQGPAPNRPDAMDSGAHGASPPRIGESGNDRQTFAAALDDAAARPAPADAPRIAQPVETPVDVQALPDATSAAALLTSPLAAPAPVALSGIAPAGNASPGDGNISPLDAMRLSTTGGNAQSITAGHTPTPHVAAENIDPLPVDQRGGSNAIGYVLAATPQRPGPDTLLQIATAEAAAAPAAAQTMSTAQSQVDQARTDTLRTGMLGSFEFADADAPNPQQGGDLPGNDARPAPQENLLKLIANGGGRSSNIVAEFNLNTAQAPAPVTDMTTATARVAGGLEADLLQGQRVLQPLGDQAQWSQGLGQRLLMMSDAGLQTARIKLHPEHLGQLDVTIEIEDDAARVWFTAANGQARDAIEEALPRLREMFGDKGLDLVRTDVSGDSRQSGDRNDMNSDDPPATPTNATPDGLASVMRVSDRLVDIYA